VVTPSQIIAVSSPAPGIVKAVRVERGDRVQKGQVLLDLDSELETAQSQLAQAKTDFAARKLERNRDMIQKKLLSDIETDQMQTDARVAALESAVAGKNLDRHKTVSPIDGIIVARRTAPGEFVGTDPVFDMVSLDPLNIELVMKVEVYGQMKIGAPVRLTLGAPVNGVRLGTVSIVDRVVDARSGTFGVRVQLANPDMAIPSGIACTPRFGGAAPQMSSTAPARSPTPPADAAALNSRTR